jgi:AcrR family transcriptional regulator
MDQAQDTKLKIMEVARVLFAQQGFEGTSIRDIAKIAEVNVASINYYFSNKENLFDEIIRMGYLECSEELSSFYEKNKASLEETLIFLFRYFLTKSHDLNSYFKMMLSSVHNQRYSSKGTPDESFGPPGGAVIIQALQKELTQNIKDEDLHWALKSLFGHVIHMALMYPCCFKNADIPYTQIDDLEKSIRRLARVILLDLNSHERKIN